MKALSTLFFLTLSISWSPVRAADIPVTIDPAGSGIAYRLFSTSTGFDSGERAGSQTYVVPAPVPPTALASYLIQVNSGTFEIRVNQAGGVTVPNGVSATVTGGNTVTFNTVPVVIDTDRFTGEWKMDGVSTYASGPATLDLLPLMDYALTLGELPTGAVFFGVDENGDVVEDTLSRNINSYRLDANTLTLNETTLLIEPDASAAWRIFRITPDSSGTVGAASVVLVPDVDYRIALKAGSDFATYTQDFVVTAPCEVDQPEIVLDGVTFYLKCRPSLERIVESGLDAPGTTGPVFSAFGQSTVDSAGGFAVRGLLSGGGVSGSTNAGIWVGENADLATLDLFTREGDLAPGTVSNFGDSGSQFSEDQSPAHNADADIVFQATLTDGRSGVWTGNALGLVLVAITGMSPPGVFGAAFCSFESTVLNDQGQVAFVAGLDGGAGCVERSGIWLYTPGGASVLTKVARLGDVAPGASDGASYVFLHDPILNHAGDIAFMANLGYGPNEAIFVGNPQSGPALDMLARIGEQVPGQSGVTFASTFVSGSLGLNNEGTLVFVSGNRDPGFFWGIWTGDYRSPSSLMLAVRAAQPVGGDAAPGFDPGVTFRFPTRADINDEEEIAFQAFVNASANTTILDSGVWFIRTDEVVEIVARTGAPVPGYGPSTTVPENSVFFQSLNARGEVVFKAFAEGPGFAHPDLGFWISRPNDRDHPVLAAISGQQVEVDTEIRRLDPLDINFTTVGSTTVAGPAQLDDRGRLLLTGKTVDSSGNIRQGVFLASVNSAPTANAGPGQRVFCASANGSLVTLDGSGSFDSDGDPLAFSWTGPFPENGGAAAGEMPMVTLDLGSSTVTLAVNDGEFDSDHDSVDVTVTVDVSGLLPPFAPLVQAGDPVILPSKAFKLGRTLPLKLQIGCGSQNLTDIDVAAPVIAAIVRVGEAPLDLETIDLNAGESNDDGLSFRFSDDKWIYNLRTTDFQSGEYRIDIQVPDGETYSGGFVLR